MAKPLKLERDLIEEMLRREPELGGTDVSKCLPGWITKFCDAFTLREGSELAHSEVGNLLHTLVAARLRAERLVRERDEALKQLAQLKGESDA